MVEVITLEDLKELKPIECPTRGGINFPCAICQECEIGEAAITFGDGVLLENTVNSVLIHISLGLSDGVSFERTILKELKTSLSKIVPIIQRGDWDDGDMAVLIADDKKDDKELIERLNKFVTDFQIQWRKLSIESSRMVKEWSDRTAKKLAHQYFKELADTR